MAIDSAKAKPSQEIVPIQEIRDGIIILKDGSLRMILMCSALNFALKSGDEQEAIIAGYQSFLNSLDFSLQIFISSRRLNIEPYLDILREAEKKQLNDLLKIQTKEYIDFVKNFVAMEKIVSKTFYAVVPYTPPFLEIKSGGIMGGVFGALKLLRPGKRNVERIEEAKFEEYRSQLWQRMEAIISGLARVGVRTAPLNTEEAIELFYGLYNPGELEKGKPPTVQNF